ncbi:MAG TPA: PDZ domain-containing protein [Acidimicrobiales bacterium]|nr:PDZ domain-containing protein [Acidimicrobiales bacterium]
MSLEPGDAGATAPGGSAGEGQPTARSHGRRLAALRQRPAQQRARRRRLGYGVGALVAAVLAATLVSLPYYAIVPGAGVDVAGLIAVPRRFAHHHRGQVLLTDVELVPLRAITWPYYRLDPNAEIVPAAELTGPASAAQYDEQGVIDMAAAREAATYVALRTLGYRVRAVEQAPVVYQPFPGAPAAGELAVGDVVTAVDGHPTGSFGALVAAVRAHRPGTTVIVRTHLLGAASSSTRQVTLGVLYRLASGVVCERAGAPAPRGATATATACLGLAFARRYAVAGAPFAVRLRSDGIVGPSAGLAFTLGLIEELDRGDLTGGRRVAATGTMSLDGQVGDVGGVAQKTVAVRDAGASVFFVPPAELATARAHAGPRLKVFAVSSVGQAIDDLRRLGGSLVASTGP